MHIISYKKLNGNISINLYVIIYTQALLAQLVERRSYTINAYAEMSNIILRKAEASSSSLLLSKAAYVPEWSKGVDSSSTVEKFAGSNPVICKAII